MLVLGPSIRPIQVIGAQYPEGRPVQEPHAMPLPGLLGNGKGTGQDAPDLVDSPLDEGQRESLAGLTEGRREHAPVQPIG